MAEPIPQNLRIVPEYTPPELDNTQIQVPDHLSTSKVQAEAVKEDSARLQKQVKIENATTASKLGATLDTWENTYLATSIDYVKNDLPYLMDDDPEFKDNLTTDFLMNTMLEHGITPNYFQRLREAKNQEHLTALIDETKEDIAKEKSVDNVLNSYGGLLTEKTVASLATGILGDVDTAIPVFGIAAKITKMSKLMATAAMTTHVGASAIAYKKDPNVSGGEAMLSATLGGAIDGVFISRIGREVTPSQLSSTLSDTPDDDLLSGIVRDTDTRDHRATVQEMLVARGETKLSPEQVEASKLLEVADEVTPTGKPTKRALKAQERLDELGYQTELKPKTVDEVEEILQAEAKNVEETRRAEFLKTRREELLAEAEDLTTRRQKQVSALKRRIVKRLEESKARGFRTLENMKKRIDKKLSDAEAKKLADDMEWETKYLAKEAQDIADDMVGFKAFIKDLGKRIKTSADDTTAKDTLESVRGSVKRLFDEGYLDKSSFDQATSAINKANGEGFENVRFTFREVADGMYEMVAKGADGKPRKVSKKGVLIPAGVLFSATALQADEGGVSTSGIFGMMLALGVLGFAVVNAPTILSKTRTALKSGGAKMKVKGAMKNRDEIIERARIGFMERYAQIKNDGTKELSELADDMLWNALDGSANSADTIRHILSNTWIQPMLKELDLTYKNWVVEQGITKLDRVGNMFKTSLGYRQKFEVELFKAIEAGDDFGSPAIRQAMDKVNEIKAKALQDMKDAGVKGAESIIPDTTYMPRKIRHGNFGTVLRSITDESVEDVVAMFTKMMDGDRVKARAYVLGIKEYGRSRDVINTMDGLKDFMRTNGITGVSADEMAGFLGIGTRLNRDTFEVGEQFGRTKRRINIDKNKFEDLTLYTKDGEEYPITLDSVFVNQVSENLSSYFKQVAGHVALATKNISAPEAYAKAGKARLTNNKVAMEQIIDDILGLPILDEYGDGTKLMRDLSNYNVASTMGMSVISLVQELSLTLINLNGSGFKTALSEFKNIVLKHGKESEIVQSFTRGTGVGMHKYSSSYGAFNHLSDGNLMDGSYRTTKAGGMFTKGGEMLRDFTLYNLGMVPVSDYLSKVAITSNAQFLYEIANGLKHVPQHRLDAYGLTKESMAIAKKHMHLLPNGELKAIDWDNIQFNERVALQSVLFNMNQKQIMQTMMGNTGHWTSSSSLGMGASQLLKFPMGAYSNHGLFAGKGMMNGDLRSYGETMGWFVSGYMASVIRSEVKGQEKTEQEHLQNAVLSMSVMGIINVGRGVSDPSIADLGERMSMLQQVIKGR